MFFVILARDRPDTAALRAATRQSHMAYLDGGTQSLRVLQSGPLLDDAGTICGSLIIGEARDIAGARQFAVGDPYSLAGIFATLEVRPWDWRRGNSYLNDPPAIR